MRANQTIDSKAAEPGQYRLSYKLTDAKQHTIEGGYVFIVRSAFALVRMKGRGGKKDKADLPTAENVHQVVQRVTPEAQVVYIDNDPVVLAHGRALLEENENCRFVAQDIALIKPGVLRRLILASSGPQIAAGMHGWAAGHRRRRRTRG